MNGFPNYSINIEEIHHTQKLDSPSGTAKFLLDKVAEEHVDEIYPIYGREGMAKREKQEV